MDAENLRVLWLMAADAFGYLNCMSASSHMRRIEDSAVHPAAAPLLYGERGRGESLEEDEEEEDLDPKKLEKELGRYLELLSVGVSREQVELKMRMDGENVDLLARYLRNKARPRTNSKTRRREEKEKRETGRQGKAGSIFSSLPRQPTKLLRSIETFNRMSLRPVQGGKESTEAMINFMLLTSTKQGHPGSTTSRASKADAAMVA